MQQRLSSIRRGIEIYRRYYLKRETPVIIYSTGRVGSMAMYAALKQRGKFVIHLHTLRPSRLEEQPGTTRWVYRHIVQQKNPAQFIVIVGRPVGTMVSDFFPKLNWIAGDASAAQTLSVDELCDLFNTRYFEQNRHIEKLEWLHNEVRPMLGIDLYKHPFAKELGYQLVHADPHHVLVITADLDDQTKAQQVADFVGLDDFEIPRLNVGDEKYGAVYKQFKAHLKIDSAYLDMIYQSRFAQHFYSPETLARFRAKWSREDR